MSDDLRIVIVEDNALIAMDLADLLIGIGHDVCAIAHTQVDAVAAAERYHPNLMIVDSQLKEGTGVGAMGEILAQGFVPHFYVTGEPAELQKLGPDVIIVSKPFNLHGLIDGIERARHPRTAPDAQAG